MDNQDDTRMSHAGMASPKARYVQPQTPEDAQMQFCVSRGINYNGPISLPHVPSREELISR